MALTQNPVPPELYPSASEKGEAIPLSVVRPIGLIKLDAIAATPVTVSLIEPINICSIYCTQNTILSLEDSATEGDILTNAMYLLAGIIYELALPQDVTIESEADGLVVINILQRWSQIKNPGSYQIG